ADGKTDLAVANYGGGNVSILLGNGNGTLAAAVNYTSGANPSSVTTGDFNRDGKTDLAVADMSGSNNVSILINSASALSTAKAITGFTFPGQTGSTTINEGAHTVAVTMPNGTDVTALVPTITHTGASVSPASGVGHDFTTPQTYTVTAEDASIQDYTVTVTVDATDIFLAKWNALGGAPGNSTGVATAIAGGIYKNYVNGRLYWNQSTDTVYWVHGAILIKYDQKGRETGALGLPVSDELDVVGITGAVESDFTGGRIYWGPSVGTYYISTGAIMTRYLAGGGPAAFGLPISDEYTAWDGRAQNMQRATLTWDGTANPAYAVYGGILVKYNMLGGPTGALHLATGEEMDVPGVTGARVSAFQNGNVYWSMATGSHTVNGGIFVRYTMFGGPASALGLPITDEYPLALNGGAARSAFQHGFITWWAPYGTWVDVI
ncbi:MAG: FG-GAP-like repeat-containing protein, partial [Thermoleophilia bacterium]|nr:FG-GAP-like repeat-containing protein [Thermoleophilia bacterium]